MGGLNAALGRSDSLADLQAAGVVGGSGMTEPGDAIEAPGGDAGLRRDPMPVPGVQHMGAASLGPVPAGDLAPARREGLGRAQRHSITLGISHEEYVDSPDLDGRHAVIVGRPIVQTADRMLPWTSAPDVLFRTVPPRDADNPAPGDCGGAE